MKFGKGYSCYKVLNRGEILTILREQDLVKFPEVVLHHVTWEFGVMEGYPIEPTSARVIGVKSNDKIQALVVEIHGTGEEPTKRPDGKTLHITLSLDKAAGAKPVHSNDLLTNMDGVMALNIPLDLEPAFIPF